MASKLYSILIFLYQQSIRLSSTFNPKAKKFIEGRINLFEKLSEKLEPKKRIWFHCASVGEFEQAIPLWKKLASEYPNYQFIFSFFSPSGYEYALKNFPELTISYLPIDQRKRANDFIELIQPELAIFIKYEFWHNHLRALNNNRIPILLVSGIFRKNQVFFKAYGTFFRKSLTYFNHFFVQNQESIKLLNSIGLNNASISGDTRYERVLENKETSFSDSKIEEFVKNKSNILICGSVWESDNEALDTIQKSMDDSWKIILVPHEPSYFKYKIEKDISIYSQEINNNHPILLVDKIGILSKLYRYATVAYIGGGFGKGIHNILEAAIYKVPIIIGPNHKKFQEAQDLINLNQVFTLNVADNTQVLEKARTTKTEILEKAYSFMTEKANATEHILVFIKKHRFL